MTNITDAPASSPAAPDRTDEVLAALRGLGDLIKPAPPVSPAPGSVPRAAGMAQLAGPVPPQPEPAAPPQVSVPHPDETFSPGEMGYYRYHRNGDPEGQDRVQLVSVVHVTGEHTYGMVLGDVRDLAQFANGQLTHEYPDEG